jgi:glycosyltransferase involved in cell wall biosynthesis
MRQNLQSGARAAAVGVVSPIGPSIDSSAGRRQPAASSARIPARPARSGIMLRQSGGPANGEEGQRGVRIGINGYFLREPWTGMGQHLTYLLAALDAREAGDERYALLVPRFAGGPSPSGETGGAPRTALGPLARRFSAAEAGVGPKRLPVQLAKLWWEQAGVLLAGRRARIELLHSPYWTNPLWSPWPTVVTVHDVIQLVLPEYQMLARQRVYFGLVTRALRRATAIITVSECSRRDLIRTVGVPGERVFVVENAIPEGLHTVRDPAALEAIRARYGLGERFVLYLGANDLRKNLDRLIRAYAALPARVRDAHQLVVAGRQWPRDHPLYPDPRRVVRELGLEDRVVFTGGVPEEEKATLLSAATVFAFPSLYEGFGLPVLEAMACGTPVLTANGSSLPEVTGDAALLVDPTDVAAIGRGLAELLESPERRCELAERGLERAGRYRWAQVAERTVAVYRLASRQSAVGSRQ